VWVFSISADNLLPIYMNPPPRENSMPEGLTQLSQRRGGCRAPGLPALSKVCSTSIPSVLPAVITRN